MSYNKSAMRYVHSVSDNPEMAHNKIIARVADKSSVLEFGPASGAMTKVLSIEKKCKVSIVEIDTEAYEVAKQYAEDGICCDIQSFSWVQKFDGQKFDYILFVDVLEHLTRAQEVLEKCGPFLNENGSILISVPNSAHNSVIIQLLQNNLMYQNTGILDYTHVHMYAFSELERLIDDSGYKSVYLDATYISVGKNEFNISYKDLDAEIANYLKMRPLGEVYQFIFEIKKADYVKNKRILLEDSLGIDKNVCTIPIKEDSDVYTEDILAELVKNPNKYFVMNNEISRLRLLINDIFEAFPSLENNTNLVQRNFAYQEEVREKNKHIFVLQKQLDEIKGNLKIKEEISSDLSVENTRLQNQNDKYLRKHDNLENLLEDKTDDIERLKQIIKNKEGHIEQLLEVERAYERDKASRSYKIALGIRKISHFFLPENSKRRFFAKVIVRCLKHPSFIFVALNPRRIRTFYNSVKNEGMEGVNLRYKCVEQDADHQSSNIDNSSLDLFPVDKNGKGKTIDKYSKLDFAVHVAPEVSIVIPVYNQFGYTYNCLKAIQKHSGDVAYEIIIADDCSTDATEHIKDAVSGITVVRNKENLRFLLNCNNAAKHAKGKYILFLNNDTQVQKNWLRPLVDLMSDSTIGMVGSKLVYADGRLQEAGGILWKDGSAWNYGNKKNPEDPEYNYVKEVDYISGAAIMIRKSLWEEIGGFDEQFAPAYCEDSDLAFEVRKHGYKVVYQPLSVVVHFEGVSNGTDLSCGQKAYQVANSKKFYEKWKNVLEKENFDNAENVFIAKDRSRFKKHILVVDQYVPMYDKDAGCKTSYMYLKMFLKMGFQVTFIGDNFFKHEPYTTELNQLGIEVLYGNYYGKNWKAFLKENLKYFDYVYLQRPHIASKYIDIVKEYGNAKIIYYAHDLHHVREKREYELTGDRNKLESSEKWKKIEYDLFTKADVGQVVGKYEQEIMQKAFPNKPIRSIPIFIYDTIPQNVRKDFSQRQDLMYVGGFGHPPNVDCVLWFSKEVMPLIVEKYPDIKWHIVGSKATDEVKALASKNIIVDGFLSDEELAEMYNSCRIDIAPLRFGAGVKGKVVEAAYYQIPLVTTSIGAEGLDDSVGNMHVVDDAKEMADYICNMYENYDALREMSDAGKVFIEKYLTPKSAEDILRLDMDV